MPDSPERQSRTCAKCKVVDTHAHHVQYLSLVHPVTNEPVDLSISKHVQCCAADGCGPCGTDVRHAAANNVPAEPSDEFTAYMQAKTAAHHQELWDVHRIASTLAPIVLTPAAETETPAPAPVVEAAVAETATPQEA